MYQSDFQPDLQILISFTHFMRFPKKLAIMGKANNKIWWSINAPLLKRLPGEEDQKSIVPVIIFREE